MTLRPGWERNHDWLTIWVFAHKWCTLADANEQRDRRLFADLAQWLMPRAREFYGDEPQALDLDAPVYALDASLIDLSLALCPWAN